MLTGKAYLESLPRKRMGTGVLFFDSRGRVLLVKPNYKDHWTVPGGVVDKDESPRQAGEREIKEEIGLELKLKQLVVVNYNFTTEEKDENLQWWFYGGILTVKEIERIEVDGKEIGEFKFATIAEAIKLSGKNFNKLIKIINRALRLKMAVYLEDWEEIKW